MLVIFSALLPEAWTFYLCWPATASTTPLMEPWTFPRTLLIFNYPFACYCPSSYGAEISLSLSLSCHFHPMVFPLGDQFRVITFFLPHDTLKIFEEHVLLGEYFFTGLNILGPTIFSQRHGFQVSSSLMPGYSKDTHHFLLFIMWLRVS